VAPKLWPDLEDFNEDWGGLLAAGSHGLMLFCCQCCLPGRLVATTAALTVYDLAGCAMGVAACAPAVLVRGLSVGA